MACKVDQGHIAGGQSLGELPGGFTHLPQGGVAHQGGLEARLPERSIHVGRVVGRVFQRADPVAGVADEQGDATLGPAGADPFGCRGFALGGFGDCRCSGGGSGSGSGQSGRRRTERIQLPLQGEGILQLARFPKTGALDAAIGAVFDALTISQTIAKLPHITAPIGLTLHPRAILSRGWAPAGRESRGQSGDGRNLGRLGACRSASFPGKGKFPGVQDQG